MRHHCTSRTPATEGLRATSLRTTSVPCAFSRTPRGTPWRVLAPRLWLTIRTSCLSGGGTDCCYLLATGLQIVLVLSPWHRLHIMMIAPTMTYGYGASCIHIQSSIEACICGIDAFKPDGGKVGPQELGSSQAFWDASCIKQNWKPRDTILTNRGVGDLVLVYKRVTGLAGHTSRVAELLEQVQRLSSGDPRALLPKLVARIPSTCLRPISGEPCF